MLAVVERIIKKDKLDHFILSSPLHLYNFTTYITDLYQKLCTHFILICLTSLLLGAKGKVYKMVKRPAVMSV